VLDPGLLETKGARSEATKYTTLATMKFFAGLETQRSPFAPIDTRYASRFMSGKASLIAGSNCEVSNKLTLQRRPGNVTYAPLAFSFPINYFYGWEQVSPPNISTMFDSTGTVSVFSPTATGYYLSKADALLTQSSFLGLGNTLYIGNSGFGTGANASLYGRGFKIVGPNLLLNSNTFSSTWSLTNVVMTGSQADPVGGATAFQAAFSSGSGTGFFLQSFTPSTYPSSTPFQVDLNTFTFSIWAKGTVGQTISLQIKDQSGNLGGATFPLTTSWARYQVTATSGAGSTSIQGVVINGNTGAQTYDVYGAQLEVGGPATPTQITTTKAQGLYRWGIDPPSGAPTFTTGSGGLSSLTGYSWYFAYFNSTTGHVSNVSLISVSSGAQTSKEFNLSGARSADPQVDSIMIFRNVDGGGFFFQVATIANPPSGGWTYTDNNPDTSLNTQLYAPIGLINNIPPAGLTGLEYHANRVWGFVTNVLYYSAGADNAAALNILQNGVSAESWPPLNTLTFDAPLTRIVSTNAGLLVFTTKDVWIILGQDLTTFAPTKILKGHGLRNFNALDYDGSTLYMYSSDRELLALTPGSGSVEIGFPIGDQLELNFDPTKALIARHVAGSQDNAVYIGDGSTGWYRLNPNQVGASLSGEQSPVFSPFATIGGGVTALNSIETSFGVKQLLIGQISGNILNRSLTTFTDANTPYTWSATIGSLILATAGTLCEVESVTVEELLATPQVAVLLDEISGAFETLPNSVPDPPDLAPSASLNSLRFYLSQGTVPPLARHMQIQLSGAATNTKDEILSVMVRGALQPEQI
jgi:hypothetical protein